MQGLSNRTQLDRRQFLWGTVAVGAMAVNAMAGPTVWAQSGSANRGAGRAYQGPNVIIIRFGGGARRRETIDLAHTYSPYLVHQLIKRGTLFSQMEISALANAETSHGQGTLNILTGKYDGYEDVNQTVLGERFEAKAPTLFEYVRKAYDIPAHQTLIVNGEDRIDEEFYTFSNHHTFGVKYRSTVLSLYRFKVYVLRQQIAAGNWKGQALVKKQQELAKMEALDHRVQDASAQSPHLQSFWQNWRRYYGDSGLVNPRGDRVLTALSIRAIRELRPKLMMVNYNDCDYVHWGYKSHYTRGIQIMDEGVEQIMAAVEADDAYRNNTIFAIVPDCGRDDNRFVAVPYQHHFGTRSAHEIFALFLGPGVKAGQVVDRPVDQISVAATLGALMNCPTPLTEGPVLEEAIA